MTTLVTGAAGHVGTNLVRALVEKKESVRVLLRRSGNNNSMESLDVERVYGDLRDRKSLEEVVRGCQYIYHLGALISIRYGDERNLFETNVLGTRKLLQCALKAGVERVVHCSSFGAIGINPTGPSNERWTVNPLEPISNYELTKFLAEYEVLHAVTCGLNVTIANPSAVVGPWDYQPSLFGKTIVDFCNGKMKAYVAGDFVFVSVYDVVEGLQLTMAKGQVGNRYLLSGEVVTIDEILSWLSEFTGVPRPRIRIPFPLMKNIAWVKDWVQRRYFPSSAPRFTYHSIRHLNSGKRADNSKARKELGFQPTSVKKALEEAVNWFSTHGYIKSLFNQKG